MKDLIITITYLRYIIAHYNLPDMYLSSNHTLVPELKLISDTDITYQVHMLSSLLILSTENVSELSDMLNLVCIYQSNNIISH